MIVALEGLVHAGKTSILQRLNGQKRLLCIEEYGVYANGAIHFPKFPSTAKEAFRANDFFFKLEEKRFQSIQIDTPLILLDRCLFSVLSVNWALERFYVDGFQCFERTYRDILTRYSDKLPQLCILLHISTDEVLRRHKIEGYYHPLLLNPLFNSLLADFYYEELPRLFPETSFIQINAMQPLDEVVSLVSRELL